jgi:hypothetical protein
MDNLKCINFWDITPWSPLSVRSHFGGLYRLHLQGQRSNYYSACHLISCWFLAEIISSTLKMGAICFSETSSDTQRTTRHYIPEVDTLYNHHCDDFKSYK